jgi:hypothetical protein
MQSSRTPTFALLVACGLALAIGASAQADSADQTPAQLPFGMSAEEMQAMMAAGAPGEMHAKLADGIGTWHGKTTMWMTPDAEPITSDGTSVVTPILGGRFIKVDMSGDCPGMGPWSGTGIFGYDNVAEKFQAIWISDHATGMMVGDGEMSSDGKTFTWEYTGTCPIAKGPISVRDVETITGPNTKTIESFSTDPKTGQEFKMMSIELSRD